MGIDIMDILSIVLLVAIIIYFVALFGTILSLLINVNSYVLTLLEKNSKELIK